MIEFGDFVTNFTVRGVIREQRGASVDEVVEAILALSRLNPAAIAEQVAAGGLRETFPFRIRDGETPALRRFSDVEEIPDRPLTDEEYEQFLRG